MKQDVGMDSGAMTYVPSFIKIGSGIQKLTERIHRHTQIARRSHKPTFTFSVLGNYFIKDLEGNSHYVGYLFSRWFFAWLNLRPVPPKRRLILQRITRRDVPEDRTLRNSHSL
jgi:hypothetical protein